MLLALTAILPTGIQPATDHTGQLRYENVRFAQADGTPDRTKPENYWEEVRRGRTQIYVYSNGLSTPVKTSFRHSVIGSFTAYDSGILPASASAFTLPAPTEKILHINRPKQVYVMRDAVVPAYSSKILFEINESVTKVESRFYRGKEYLRWQTMQSVIGHEEETTSFRPAVKS